MDKTDSELRDIDLKVYVYQRPHMRDEGLEFELYMGTGVLRGIFDEMKKMPEVKELFLSFPENWTNIIEQRMLYARLKHYCPNLKKLTIKTQSVYIIQCTPHNCVFIVAPGCELPSEETPINKRLYVPHDWKYCRSKRD